MSILIVPATVGGLFFTALGIHWLHEATTVGSAAWPYDEAGMSSRWRRAG
ncbi:hypothetical protein [Streptomyces sp. NPDC005780]